MKGWNFRLILLCVAVSNWVFGASVTNQLHIKVSGLSDASPFISLEKAVDISSVLRANKKNGVVDENSFRMYLVHNGKEQPIAHQFSHFEQPRRKQRQLTGVSNTVSFANAFFATNIPPDFATAGLLSWTTATEARVHQQEFVLKFVTSDSALAIQVPYPPYNLRLVTQEGAPLFTPLYPNMQIRPQWPGDGKINILQGENLVTTYIAGPSVEGRWETNFRRPFFYPVNGPDGLPLTEFGKAHDPTGSHAHHYSLWIAHANVNGQDLWGEKGGRIMHQQFSSMEDGALFARFTQTALWRSTNNTDLLEENRRVTVFASSPTVRVIDIQMDLTPVGDKPVVFGKTSFGFLATRVRQSMSVFDGAGEIINSNSERFETGAHLKHALWLDQSGPIASGKVKGIAILDHPSNPHFPTGWHCRNDGWAGASFNMDEAFTLEPKKNLRLRYRLLLHTSSAFKANIAAIQKAYAAEPKIEFTYFR